MLELSIESGIKESYNDNTGEFITFKLDHDYKITLEHSLVSISKWESKWHKPFLIDTKKTDEELVDYIKCMIITQNVPEEIVYFFTSDHFKKINAYIENPMTATTFNSYKNPSNQSSSMKKETLTSEIIYYWMIEYGIPVEFQKWHLNRLLTLIRVCNIKNNTNNKMSKKDSLLQNRSINQARRASRGAK